jgi:hypothetical protein
MARLVKPTRGGASQCEHYCSALFPHGSSLFLMRKTALAMQKFDLRLKAGSCSTTEKRGPFLALGQLLIMVIDTVHLIYFLLRSFAGIQFGDGLRHPDRKVDENISLLG